MSVYTKLLAAKMRFEPLKKSGTNPHFRSSFSTLSDMHAACHRGLTEMDLLLVQYEEVTPTGPIQVTELVDTETGEKIRSTLPLPVTNDPQVMGSAISYARRYQMAPILGLDGDLDDDGEAAAAPSRKATAPTARAVPLPAPVLANSQAPRAPFPQDAMGGMRAPECRNCKGPMWDNREPHRGGTSNFPKKNPKAPDFTCKDKGCAKANEGSSSPSVWWTNEWQKLCDDEHLKAASAEANDVFGDMQEVDPETLR